MSFQWILDNAVDIIFDKKAVTAQSISRDKTVRAVVRSSPTWRFLVTPPLGMRWNDAGVRGYLTGIDTLGLSQAENVSFAHLNLFSYLGTGSYTGTGWTAAVVYGTNSITINGAGTGTGLFKKGDILQIGGAPTSSVPSAVFTVTADATTTSITLDRPVLKETGSFTNTKVGNDCVFRIICANAPNYRITPTGIIEWDGQFEFYEVL